jgi:hypothetical protein
VADVNPALYRIESACRSSTCVGRMRLMLTSQVAVLSCCIGVRLLIFKCHLFAQCITYGRDQQVSEVPAADGEGDAGPLEPSQSFSPECRMRVFAYMLRVYAGETPECDANTAAFLAGIVRGMGSAMLRRVRGMTNEQADAAFLQWVNDQHALWGSLAVMENAAAEGEGDPL